MTNLEPGRWLTYRALDLCNRGNRAVKEITMAKLDTSELSQQIAHDCMQIHGGFGYERVRDRALVARCPSEYGGGLRVVVMKEIIAKEEKI